MKWVGIKPFVFLSIIVYIDLDASVQLELGVYIVMELVEKWKSQIVEFLLPSDIKILE